MLHLSSGLPLTVAIRGDAMREVTLHAMHLGNTWCACPAQG